MVLWKVITWKLEIHNRNFCRHIRPSNMLSHCLSFILWVFGDLPTPWAPFIPLGWIWSKGTNKLQSLSNLFDFIYLCFLRYSSFPWLGHWSLAQPFFSHLLWHAGRSIWASLSPGFESRPWPPHGVQDHALVRRKYPFSISCFFLTNFQKMFIIIQYNFIRLGHHQHCCTFS